MAMPLNKKLDYNKILSLPLVFMMAILIYGFLFLDIEGDRRKGEAYYEDLSSYNGVILKQREIELSKIKNGNEEAPPEEGIADPRDAGSLDLENSRELMVFNVPFTPQAPFAEWDDPRQQDGCEEASMLMAVKWARGEEIESPSQAKKDILAISSYLENNYDEYLDTSARDTADRIAKGYFKYNNVRVEYDFLVDDIIDELEAGSIVVVPTDGRLLGNPYFTAPGPERHMLVIRGYDPETKEFITNDPGTRKGEWYRYDADVLWNAIRDYPSGYHEPINGVKKAMIVVWR